MAIILITGAPGSGKSLLTIEEVQARAQKESRDVYYNGIGGLNLPWIEFDKPEDWNTVPIGSIILLDEAQRLLRPRHLGQKVPEYVEQFETHRHKGYDVYIITQHPLLIDSHVRRLVETHRHIMRKFGTQWVTLHEWKGVKENCDKSRADSVSTNRTLPKAFFSAYKSAEVHTHKAKVPFKILAVVVLLLCALAYGAKWYYENIQKTQSQSAAPSPGALPVAASTVPAAPSAAASVSGAAAAAPALTAQEYLKQFLPLVSGLPHTAPRYHELTKPQRVPTIRGCWITDKPLEGFDHRAVCMLDGGVYVYPPESFVQQYLRDRFFIDWENPRAGDFAAAAPRAGDAATAGRPMGEPMPFGAK